MTDPIPSDTAAQPRDEFSFLPAQAARLGHPVPAAERLALTLEDGRTLSALRYGGRAPRIVLLHGAGLNAHTWDNTVLTLGLPVLALDLPGHGDSSWRKDADYRARTIAPDAIAAIETWADAPVVLVGHSLGGLTAAAVAASRPDLVSEVVIVDITPASRASAGAAQLRLFYEQTAFPSREAVLAHAQAFGLGGDVEDARRGVFHNTRVLDDGPFGPGTVEWKHHFARLAQHALDPDAGAAALVTEDGWDDLAALDAPLTLVRATHGFIDDAAADDFAARVPAARIVTLDAPHNVQEAAPAALADLIARKDTP